MLIALALAQAASLDAAVDSRVAICRASAIAQLQGDASFLERAVAPLGRPARAEVRATCLIYLAGALDALTIQRAQAQHRKKESE